MAAEKLGYRDLKPEQSEVAKAFLEGNDVFAALPTGCDMSLCLAILLELREHFQTGEIEFLTNIPLLLLYDEVILSLPKSPIVHS